MSAAAPLRTKLDNADDAGARRLGRSSVSISSRCGLIYGLGAVTNLNSGYPWGIWVVVDIFIGTALGCGGFSMAILVYVFNRGEYHPLMRPALLGGLFGYTLGGFAAIIDLGR